MINIFCPATRRDRAWRLLLCQPASSSADVVSNATVAKLAQRDQQIAKGGAMSRVRAAVRNIGLLG